MQKLDRGAVELFWCWGDSYQSQCNVTLLLIILHLFLCLSGLPHAVWGFAEPGVLDPLAFKFAPTMVSPAWTSHSRGVPAGTEMQNRRKGELRKSECQAVPSVFRVPTPARGNPPQRTPAITRALILSCPGLLPTSPVPALIARPGPWLVPQHSDSCLS